MSHECTPAEVLRAALIAGGVGVLPASSPTPVWPIYVDHLAQSPDNAICVYDTSGRRDGRLMAGESISKPGWQIRVRATNYVIAMRKMKAIQRELDSISQLTLTLDADDYLLEAVTQTGTPLSLGQEPEATRRDNITLNGTITIKELMP